MSASLPGCRPLRGAAGSALFSRQLDLGSAGTSAGPPGPARVRSRRTARRRSSAGAAPERPHTAAAGPADAPPGADWKRPPASPGNVGRRAGRGGPARVHRRGTAPRRGTVPGRAAGAHGRQPPGPRDANATDPLGAGNAGAGAATAAPDHDSPLRRAKQRRVFAACRLPHGAHDLRPAAPAARTGTAPTRSAHRRAAFPLHAAAPCSACSRRGRAAAAHRTNGTARQPGAVRSGWRPFPAKSERRSR